MDFLPGPFGGRGKVYGLKGLVSHRRFTRESTESYAVHENHFEFSERTSLDQMSRQIIGPIPLEGFCYFILETARVFVMHIFEWFLAGLPDSSFPRTRPGVGLPFLPQGNIIELSPSCLIGISVGKENISMAGSANF